MTWVRIDDGAPLHPKLLDAGPEAAWLWTCGLAYCNRNHTDGLIAARHLAALYPGAWPGDRLATLAARLVSVRLWDADGSDYRVHDYAHYQEEATREVVDARRVYERERKRAQRLKSRPGHVPDNVPGTIAGHVPGTNTGTPPGTGDGTPDEDSPADPDARPSHVELVPAPRPVPSRPDPGLENPKSDLVDSALRAPPTRDELRAKAGREKEAARVAREAAARAKADAKQAAADEKAARIAAREKAKADAKQAAADEKAARIAAREKAEADRAEKRPPLPFKPWAAVCAIEACAGGRFVAGEERDLGTGHAIPITGHIRAYPTLAEWERLGRWLASDANTYSGTLAVAWAASAALRDGMARARAWEAQGSLPAIGMGQRRPAPPAAIPPPPVVKRGDLAVDRPALRPGSPEAMAAADQLQVLRDQLRMGRAG